MRRYFIHLLFVLTYISIYAQNQLNDSTIADAINHRAGGSIDIVQPQAMNTRLKHSGQEVTVPDYTDKSSSSHSASIGYRIQVFSDNNVHTAKVNAQSKRSMIQSRFPGVRAYVSFQAPYWRVRVGDFRTRAEAESAMADIKDAFPSMSGDLRIVKDRISGSN